MYNLLIHSKALYILLVAGIVLMGTTSGSTELEGNWRDVCQIGTDTVFLSFGSDGSFYLESQSFWYLGSYTFETDVETSALLLNVEDGSDFAHIGELFTYAYELDNGKLILETSPNPGIFESQDVGGRAVFITINYDSDDDEDDDNEFTIYASCFLDTTHQMD